MNRYKELLEELRDYLARFNVRGWPTRLNEWSSAMDNMKGLDLRAHLLRTRRALGGMGSIGDIVISPQAGDNIPDDHDAIVAANARLVELINTLDAEIAKRLEE